MKLNILNKTEPENQLKFIFGEVMSMTASRNLVRALTEIA